MDCWQKGRKGSLLLGNKSFIEDENKYITFHPKTRLILILLLIILVLTDGQVYGVLQRDSVTWSNGKVEVYNDQVDQLFYGFPELGQNLIWKPMDDDPTTFLNFYEKE